MYITLDIDLSAIPQERIKTASNGHRYIKLTASTMMQPDRYGNDMTVFVSQTREERGRQGKIYVGKGHTWQERQAQPAPAKAPAPSPVEDFPADYQFDK